MMVEDVSTSRFSQMSDWLAIGFVALTTLIMAYSYLLSVVPILVLYALWFSQIPFQKPLILRPGREMVLPLLFAFYCVFTIFWSDYSRLTLVMGLELVSMILCVVIMARIVTLEAMLKGLAVGTVLVLAFLFHTGHFSFYGLFGSKNQVGLYAEIGIFVGLLLLFHLRRNLGQMMIFAIPSLLMGLICSALSHSASSLASLVIVLGISFAAFVMVGFPKSLRPVFFWWCLFGAVTFAIFLSAYQIDLYAEILHALGKNPTLTGRTYLWGEGIRIGMDDPLLGHGYAAFWVAGQPDAERLWEEFYIPGKSGFHFHNVFVQTFVDLGAIGLLMMVMMILGSVVLSVLKVMRDGLNLETIFLLGITTMFLIRSFVEVDFLGPFGIGVLLFFWTWGRLFLPSVKSGGGSRNLTNDQAQ